MAASSTSMGGAAPRTLYDKVWAAHVVQAGTAQTPTLLYIDLHLVHEVTSPQAFDMLRRRGLRVRRPDATVATTDHSVPTLRDRSSGLPLFADPHAQGQVATLMRNCAEFGVPLHALGDPGQGIVHVIGPEQGLTRPGATVVCGDSHTSTHGAFGALAFGIGSTEVGYVLATQALPQAPARTLHVDLDGQLGRGVGAKDVILATIARLGVGGGTGHVIEYGGSAVRGLDMEGRMTLCNMSIEAGAKAGMVAPDEVTFAYLEGRPAMPGGAAFAAAVAAWRQLGSDPGARFDRHLRLDAAAVAPMVTFGTTPEMAIAVDAAVPPASTPLLRAAVDYMGLTPGRPLAGHPLDVVFIGSCTNGRIADLRAAASVLARHPVARGVRALVVPGSAAVKRQAEAEGLHEIFAAAGAQWREPGCSMCIAMNGDQVAPGETAMSTSNRNFRGRQGPGSRTLLASPLTAAASASRGCVTDPRELLA